VLAVKHTAECGEQQLVRETCALLAAHIEDEVTRLYGESPGLGGWWPDGLACLAPLAQRALEDMGTRRAAAALHYAYCPAGLDVAMAVDVRVALADLLEGRALSALATLTRELVAEAAAARAHRPGGPSAPGSPAKPPGGAAGAGWEEPLSDAEWGMVPWSLAPVGVSLCGEAAARSLLRVLHASPDSIHLFLKDPRNLAAGAARAALWIRCPPGAPEGAVVRRCLIEYTFAVLHRADEVLPSPVRTGRASLPRPVQTGHASLPRPAQTGHAAPPPRVNRTRGPHRRVTAWPSPRSRSPRSGARCRSSARCAPRTGSASRAGGGITPPAPPRSACRPPFPSQVEHLEPGPGEQFVVALRGGSGPPQTLASLPLEGCDEARPAARRPQAAAARSPS